MSANEAETGDLSANGGASTAEPRPGRFFYHRVCLESSSPLIPSCLASTILFFNAGHTLGTCATVSRSSKICTASPSSLLTTS